MRYGVKDIIHPCSCNQGIFPCIQIHSQIIAVKHFCNTRQKLVSSHGGFLLIFFFFLTFMSICNVTAKDVCNRFASFISRNKNIDFMPFFTIVRNCAIFKAAYKSVGIYAGSKRVEACQC